MARIYDEAVKRDQNLSVSVIILKTMSGKSSGKVVPRDRIELPTRGFSVPCSTD